ncbi:MAG TPA: hypothetical protein VM509_07460 [Planctomycetota bacterium]|nr:hypothetical protein [Planctomycetota bacterium]
METERPREKAFVARRVFDSLIVCVFLAALAAPAADLWIRPDSLRSPQAHEMRAPAPRPELPASMSAVQQFPSKYEAFFKDSFGLRDLLLRGNSIVKVFGFGVSPTSEAYFGKHGWIFYKGSFSQEDHRGAHPFDAVGLERWARALEHKRALLESMGCRYLYVVAPDKESIYPEHLPDSMRPIGRTRLSQFLESMRERVPKVEILDLTGALTAAKLDDAPEDWVYTRLGTHWNGRGAQVALRALLRRLNELGGGFDLGELDAFERREFKGSIDSWTTRMYIGDLITHEIHDFAVPRVRCSVRHTVVAKQGRVRKTEIEDSTRPRVVFMHDSFGPHVESALSEQCSYLESHDDMSISSWDLEAAAPAWFIDMYVERILNDANPWQLLPRQLPAWSQRFDQSKRTLVALDRSRDDLGISALGDARVGPALPPSRAQLTLVSHATTDRFAIAALVPVAGEIPVAHVTIESAVPTELLLFYRPPKSPDFQRQRCYRKRLASGVNDFYLPLDHEGTSGELQLQPGSEIGTYLLREFEIRSVPAL